MLSNLLGIKNKVFFIIIDKIVETLLKNKLGKKIFNKIYTMYDLNKWFADRNYVNHSRHESDFVFIPK